jgi:hypothetical protein
MAAMTKFVNDYTDIEYIEGRANRRNGIKRRGYMMIILMMILKKEEIKHRTEGSRGC